jgi:hypothetical protein
MSVSNFQPAAIFGLLEPDPDILRHFWMCATPQLPFQQLERRGRKFLERAADNPRPFGFRKYFKLVFQNVGRHAFNVADLLWLRKTHIVHSPRAEYAESASRASVAKGLIVNSIERSLLPLPLENFLQF